MNIMPLTCVLIGFVVSALIVCFKMENGANKKESIICGVVLFVLFTFAFYGFFCGIKGLCSYLPPR